MEEFQEACVKSTAGMYICEVCGSDFIQKCHLTRHMRIHTEQTFVCQLCSKPFSRRDKLNCHISCKHQTIMNKEQTFPCPECGKLFGRKFHLKRHKLLHSKTVNGQAVLDEMKRNARLYKEQLELGKDVANNLQEYDDIPEQSLSATHKQALELYKQSRVQCPNRYESVTLRLWQSKVISFMDSPHLRQVIWIVGARGNEGKTFLQNYISNYYGSRRVVATDIAGRKKNIAHYLAKLPLECKDIFLFNHPASASEAVAYDLLEDIKDGRTRSDKYSTEQIMFKTPNTVMVFSNEYPRTEALKKDRWRIYEIRDVDLHASAAKHRLDTTVHSKFFHKKSGLDRIVRWADESFQESLMCSMLMTPSSMLITQSTMLITPSSMLCDSYINPPVAPWAQLVFECWKVHIKKWLNVQSVARTLPGGITCSVIGW